MLQKTVVFDIPAGVVERLATGEYVRIGGIIRAKNGRIIMHLTEAGANLLPEVAIMSAAALAVVGIGICVMYQLDSVTKQLSTIDDHLKQVKALVEDVKEFQIAELKSSIAAAVEIGANGMRDRSITDVDAARRDFIKNKKLVGLILDGMYKAQDIMKLRTIYMDYVRLFSVCVQGEARCYLAAGRYDTMNQTLQDAYDRLKQWQNHYKAAFVPSVEFLEIKREELPQIKNDFVLFDEIHDILDNNRAIISELQVAGMSYFDYEKELVEVSRNPKATGYLFVEDSNEIKYAG